MAKTFGAKDKSPRKRKPNLNKIPKKRYNYFHTTEFVAQLLDKARENGFSISEVIESLVLASTTTKKISDTEYQHELVALNKPLAVVASGTPANPAVKWATWKRDLSKNCE